MATTSTLVKRGPKDRTDQEDSAAKPPAKRAKIEGGSLDDEVKQNFHKGTVSKVNTRPTTLHYRFVLLTLNSHLAHYSHLERISRQSWHGRSWEKGRSCGPRGAVFRAEILSSDDELLNSIYSISRLTNNDQALCEGLVLSLHRVTAEYSVVNHEVESNASTRPREQSRWRKGF